MLEFRMSILEGFNAGNSVFSPVEKIDTTKIGSVQVFGRSKMYKIPLLNNSGIANAHEVYKEEGVWIAGAGQDSIGVVDCFEPNALVKSVFVVADGMSGFNDENIGGIAQTARKLVLSSIVRLKQLFSQLHTIDLPTLLVELYNGSTEGFENLLRYDSTLTITVHSENPENGHQIVGVVSGGDSPTYAIGKVNGMWQCIRLSNYGNYAEELVRRDIDPSGANWKSLALHERAKLVDEYMVMNFFDGAIYSLVTTASNRVSEHSCNLIDLNETFDSDTDCFLLSGSDAIDHTKLLKTELLSSFVFGKTDQDIANVIAGILSRYDNDDGVFALKRIALHDS